MTKTIAIIVLVGVSIVVAPSAAVAQQPISRDQLDAIIKSAMNGDAVASSCMAKASFMGSSTPSGGPFDVTVTGPVGRIMRLAAEAKRQYKTFTPADVTDDMLAPVITVTAIPHGPIPSRGYLRYTPNAEHLVLKRKGASADNPQDAVQPVSKELISVEWSNVAGGQFEGKGILASFSIEDVAKLHGEIDVVVVTAQGERRCKIGADDRKKLR